MKNNKPSVVEELYLETPSRQGKGERRMRRNRKHRSSSSKGTTARQWLGEEKVGCGWTMAI